MQPGAARVWSPFILLQMTLGMVCQGAQTKMHLDLPPTQAYIAIRQTQAEFLVRLGGIQYLAAQPT